ncbi:NDR1/HIN1-like protein 13 [Linum grandiflorum]
MEPPLRQRDKGKAQPTIPSNHRHLNGGAVAPPPPPPQQQQPVAVEPPPPPPPPVCPTPPLLPPPPCATSHHGGGHHPHNHHHRHHNHQHYNPYYPSSSTSSKASLKGCCCCLLLLLSFLFLLALGIALVVILAVKPKKPQFDLQQVGVQYMGINTPTPPSTTASISLAIRMLFTAVNPNKVGIKYGESRFTVMYRGVPLGKASVPGFFQEAHSQRQVEATVAVDRYSLMQADAADLVKDASLNDRVDLRVLGEVGAKIRVMNLDSPGVEVSVDCSIVISPRKQSLTYKQCGFDGLSV